MGIDLEEMGMYSIGDLIGRKPKFFVPKYQRGYRWTKHEVEALLDDIDTFITDNNVCIEDRKNAEENTAFYCLQPVVVRFDDKENRYNLIDGQQRLTTIFLILEYLIDGFDSYSISYETREKSEEFIQNIGTKTKEEALTNIDFHYMYKAYKTIKEWFDSKTKSEADKEAFECILLKRVKVIWYPTTEKNEEAIFTRLNDKKIPLTNAELVKAHFLISEKDSGKKNILALEWDKIENALQKDNFWYFIYNEKKEYSSRIEYIFDLMVKETTKEDPFHTFEKFKDDPDNYSWEKVKLFFRTFENWFSDRDIFHYVGFLIASGGKIKNILDLSKVEEEDRQKSDFLKELKKKVNKTIYGSELEAIIDDVKNSIKDKNSILNNFLYPKNNDEKKEAIDDAEKEPPETKKVSCFLSFLSNREYGANNDVIKKVLLLFNILSLQKDKKFLARFPFESYVNEQWSLEHIHAQNSEGVKKEQRQQWIKDYVQHALKINKLQEDKSASILLMTNDNKAEDLLRKLSSIYYSKDKKENIEEESFKDLSSFLLGLLPKAEDWIDSISNMALLKKNDNSSLNNAPFSEKRQRILELTKKSFIPPCTQYVFLKYYSEYAEAPYEWAPKDRDAYDRAIAETLAIFIKETEGL